MFYGLFISTGSHVKWGNEILARENVEYAPYFELVEKFSELVHESLDEIAPIKTFSIKSNYVFGLSNKTKDLMKKRDAARKTASKANANGLKNTEH